MDVRAAGAVEAPLKALADTLDEARTDARRCRACAAALDGARVGYPSDHSNPGDPALLDVLTMCDNLVRLESDPVVGPATVLADIVRNRLVTRLDTQKHHYQGVSLYAQPGRPKDIERSYIFVEDLAEEDGAAYRKLALCKATGWDRIALNPLIASRRRAS
jgi:hypothetical protein